MLLGQPQGAGRAVDRYVGAETGDLVVLVDRIRLPLHEQPGDDAERLVAGRGDAQFVAHLLEVIGADHPLARIDGVAGIVEEVEVAGEPADAGIVRIVSLGIVGVVARLQVLAIEIGARVSHVPVAELALDRQRRLDEAVVAVFGIEVLDLKVADQRIVAVRTVALGLLVHDLRGYRPVAVELDLERGAAAVDIGVVVVLLDERGVVDADAGARGQEAAGAGDVVDGAGIALVPADHAQRRGGRQRQVDHAFELAADAALVDGVDLAVGGSIKARGVGRVGDDADGARFGRGAVKRALRAGEALDPGDVVDVDIEVAADRGHRLLVEIDADRGQRARVVAVATTGDAAHVDDVVARIAAQRLERHRGELLHVIGEAGDVEILQLLRAQCLDADRHVLQALAAFLRGDDDVGVTGFCGIRRRSILRDGGAGDHGGGGEEGGRKRSRTIGSHLYRPS